MCGRRYLPCRSRQGQPLTTCPPTFTAIDATETGNVISPFIAVTGTTETAHRFPSMVRDPSDGCAFRARSACWADFEANVHAVTYSSPLSTVPEANLSP
jgi:hypothetical protein